MSGGKGYIKLYRKVRDNWKWPGIEKKRQPYSLIEAWEDLIMEACYKPATRLLEGRLFHLKRGEQIASIRYLARRWNWKRHKTLIFLEKLQHEKEIVRKTAQGMGHITICKYDHYNPEGDSKGDSEGTLRGQRGDKSNKVKKVKKDNVEGEPLRLASLLFSKIQERKPDYKKPNLQSWAKDIDLMLRQDKRKPEIIEKVILWCQTDDFWQNNILSTGKLRKQFDRLELEMAKPKKGRDSPPAEVRVAEVPVGELKSDISQAESKRRARALIQGLADGKSMPNKGEK